MHLLPHLKQLYSCIDWVVSKRALKAKYFNFINKKSYILLPFILLYSIYYVMATVLVVDDDKDIIEVVTIILEKYNYNVICLNSAENLAAHLQQIKPSVVLLDSHLKGVDSRHICKEVKETGMYENTKIILFTADSRYIPEAATFLFDDCLEKPFDMQELLSKIEMNTHKAKT